MHAERPAISYEHMASAQMELIGELGRLMGEGARRFCDIGGGANPIVSLRKVAELSLDYVVLDAAEGELDKTPAGYSTVAADVLDEHAIGRLLEQCGRFDVVTSRWAAEHMHDGGAFHRRVFEMLEPGGAAVHLFPTLYSPVFVLNRVLPAGASAALLNRGIESDRSDAGRHPKFRSYYSWCRGPSQRQLARLRGVGFEVERYTGFFGHVYYSGLPPLDRLQRLVTKRLLAHPVAALTSFALVVLRRPRWA
jgi:hypothetical protein